MNPEISEGRMFRESAVREYLAGREGSVIPAFTGAKVTTALWLLAVLIIAGMIAFTYQVKVPAYDSTAVLAATTQQGTLILLPDTDEAYLVQELLLTTNAEGVPERWVAEQVLASNLPAHEVAARYNLPEGLLASVGNERYNVLIAEREDEASAADPLSTGAYPALITTSERSVFDLLTGGM